MKNTLVRSRLLLSLCLLLAAPALWSCNTETDFAKSLRRHEEKQRAVDSDTIRNYLRRNNYQFVAQPSGLHLVTLVANAQGAPATAGSEIRVKYVGRFLSGGPAGTVFDNSTENRSGCGCAAFRGTGDAVPGFTEGLLTMRVGERKLFLVPSRLAYGVEGQRNASGNFVIPPDAVLLFDVEVLSVTR
jgi:FKBP-type peptidyl-prolyl cis-trans isomerase